MKNKKWLWLCVVLAALIIGSGAGIAIGYLALPLSEDRVTTYAQSHDILLTPYEEVINNKTQYVSSPSLELSAEYLNSLIRIDRYSISTPDSTGNVDWTVEIENLSGMDIQCIAFKVEALNDIGKQVEDEVTGDLSEDTLMFYDIAAPIKSHTSKKYIQERAWCNSTIVTSKITLVWVEYTDGSTLAIPKEAIQQMNIKSN